MQKTMTVTSTTNQRYQFNLETKILTFPIPGGTSRRRIAGLWASDPIMDRFVQALVRTNFKPRRTIIVPAGDNTNYIWDRGGDVHYQRRDGKLVAVRKSRAKANIIRSLLKKV